MTDEAQPLPENEVTPKLCNKCGADMKCVVLMGIIRSQLKCVCSNCGNVIITDLSSPFNPKKDHF